MGVEEVSCMGDLLRVMIVVAVIGFGRAGSWENRRPHPLHPLVIE